MCRIWWAQAQTISMLHSAYYWVGWVGLFVSHLDRLLAGGPENYTAKLCTVWPTLRSRYSYFVGTSTHACCVQQTFMLTCTSGDCVTNYGLSNSYAYQGLIAYFITGEDRSSRFSVYKSAKAHLCWIWVVFFFQRADGLILHFHQSLDEVMRSWTLNKYCTFMCKFTWDS